VSVVFKRLVVAVTMAAILAAAPSISARSSRHAKSAKSATTSKSGATTKSAVKSKSSRTSKSVKTSKSSRTAKSADDTTVTQSRSRRGRKAVKVTRLHGQQGIDPARVTEIQQALIREHYLTNEANGTWDAETIAAMQKYQADNGWQTKLMPDSRALKKLGLGPDYSNAINASGSSFVTPAATGSSSNTQAADFAAAAGVSQ
jgi:hypothetical protein